MKALKIKKTIIVYIDNQLSENIIFKQYAD